jgi:hypothetical protein
MIGDATTPRSELADARPDFFVIERSWLAGTAHGLLGRAGAPKESDREGEAVWSFADAPRSSSSPCPIARPARPPLRRAARPALLLRRGPGSTLPRIGETGHAAGVSVYAAITCASPSGVPLELTGAKLQLLNRALDDRLRTSARRSSPTRTCSTSTDGSRAGSRCSTPASRTCRRPAPLDRPRRRTNEAASEIADRLGLERLTPVFEHEVGDAYVSE